MNASLLLSILSVLVPLTGAIPGHGHSHAHIHRDFHDNVQRDRGHTHGHVHRDALDLQPVVEARVIPSPGCGRRPKSKGTGKGKPVLSSSAASLLPTGPSTNLGGIFVTSATDAVAASTTSTSEEVSSPTIVGPEIPVTTAVSNAISSSSSSSSSLEAVETPKNVAVAAVPSNSASVLQSFQHSYTLATSTSAVGPVTTSTSATATITAGSGSGSWGSGSGGASTGDADHLTVFVRNMMTDSLTTSHAMNADLPANILAITATLTDGTMAPGATASMIYPSGWAGNMAAAKAPSTDDEVVDLADASLIEGSFVVQLGDAPVNDMDVSYVSGFSVPITCSCQEETVVFGCSIDLFEEGECPDTCSDGSCLVGSTCRNPLRDLDVAGLTAVDFFLPCQGKAFTWAQDGANAQNSRCTSNYITCCIGTEADGCPSTS
ncbi:hypothetical protein N0V93_009959 [Gnomoniopsis smithogilvyi]|uniref:Thaumatin-like protein n=1 Tax=Gnomoniopsis smithogilvyi TaxID=1191159 RepID=A0A9W8YIB4_9PEZI|nr:hypothetical protein N0V93_009959 [Gnomoniopsis smithogilvyi]